MKKLTFTPLELALIVSLTFMTVAAAFAASSCHRSAKSAEFWQHQFTNSIITLHK